MKNLKLVFLLMMFFFNIASAYPLNEFLDFYVGVDTQIRRMKFKEGFGAELLHKTHPQGNLYVGLKLNENFAFEIGHESTVTRTCNSTLIAGQCAAGTNIPAALEPITFKTKAKIKGPHFSVIGFYPFEDSPTRLLAGIGISSYKGTVERKTVQFGTPPHLSGTVRTMSKHRISLRCMGGAQYLTDFGLGFRGTLSFIKTRRMVIRKSDDHKSIFIPTIKPKDSLVYGLGCFYSF